MKKSNITKKHFILTTIIFMSFLLLIALFTTSCDKYRKEKKQVLEHLEKTDSVYVKEFYYEYWYDDYILELLPTLNEKQLQATIIDFSRWTYGTDLFSKLLNQIDKQKYAEWILPSLLEWDKGRTRLFFLYIEIFNKYENPWLLKGVQSYLDEESQKATSLSQLAALSNEWQNILWNSADEFETDGEDYYKFYIHIPEHIKEHIQTNLDLFYKEKDLGGYYDQYTNNTFSGAYQGNGGSNSYYGDFYVQSQSSISFDSQYNPVQSGSTRIKFRDKSVPGTIRPIAYYEYYCDGYLIWIRDNYTILVKTDGSRDYFDGFLWD